MVGWNFIKLNINQEEIITGELKVDLYSSDLVLPPFDPSFCTKSKISIDISIELKPYSQQPTH